MHALLFNYFCAWEPELRPRNSQGTPKKPRLLVASAPAHPARNSVFSALHSGPSPGRAPDDALGRGLGRWGADDVLGVLCRLQPTQTKTSQGVKSRSRPDSKGSQIFWRPTTRPTGALLAFAGAFQGSAGSDEVQHLSGCSLSTHMGPVAAVIGTVESRIGFWMWAWALTGTHLKLNGGLAWWGAITLPKCWADGSGSQDLSRRIILVRNK